MKYTTKAKICIIVGIGLIVFVASLTGLPFMKSDSAMQQISHENSKKLESAEEKMFHVIEQERAELHFKEAGGKIKYP